jgi:hypothetical protein
MSDDVTRWEFTELQQRVGETMHRLDVIDSVSNRGVAVIAVQVQELAKDMAKHEERHDREETARISGRRWMIGAVIAAVAAIDGPMVAVLLALHGH